MMPTERKKIAKDVKQRGAVLAQFVEASGVTHLGSLRQEDMFYYDSVLERLPKIYRKTPEDQARTLDEILERGGRIVRRSNRPFSGDHQPQCHDYSRLLQIRKVVWRSACGTVGLVQFAQGLR